MSPKSLSGSSRNPRSIPAERRHQLPKPPVDSPLGVDDLDRAGVTLRPRSLRPVCPPGSMPRPVISGEGFFKWEDGTTVRAVRAGIRSGKVFDKRYLEPMFSAFHGRIAHGQPREGLAVPGTPISRSAHFLV